MNNVNSIDINLKLDQFITQENYKSTYENYLSHYGSTTNTNTPEKERCHQYAFTCQVEKEIQNWKINYSKNRGMYHFHKLVSILDLHNQCPNPYVVSYFPFIYMHAVVVFVLNCNLLTLEYCFTVTVGTSKYACDIVGSSLQINLFSSIQLFFYKLSQVSNGECQILSKERVVWPPSSIFD